jgi:hypothetical protein
MCGGGSSWRTSYVVCSHGIAMNAAAQQVAVIWHLRGVYLDSISAASRCGSPGMFIKVAGFCCLQCSQSDDFAVFVLQ